MCGRGLTERHALQVIGMSASSLRYRPAPDRNAELRQTIVALAHRHRRYGAGMIYLKVRQQGRLVNHKRIERLYAEAQLQSAPPHPQESAGRRASATGKASGCERRLVHGFRL